MKEVAYNSGSNQAIYCHKSDSNCTYRSLVNSLEVNIIYIEQKSKRDTTTIKSLTYIPWAKYLFEMFLETTVPYIHGLPILNYES